MEKQLVADALQTLREFVPSTINESRNVAEMFRIDMIEEPMKRMISLFEGYIWITDVLRGLQKQGVQFDVDIARMNSILTEMESTLVSKDYVLLSDLLEYEMNDILSLVLEQVERLA